MASYGAQVRKITTAEINRLLREANYSRWAYFVDATADKVGVVFANDEMFGAYAIDDEPDPKLHQYGLEKITDLSLTRSPHFFLISAGQNDFQARLFNNPMVVEEDDFLPNFSYDTVLDWQQFLEAAGAHVAGGSRETGPSLRTKRLVMGSIIGLIIIFCIIALI